MFRITRILIAISIITTAGLGVVTTPAASTQTPDPGVDLQVDISGTTVVIHTDSDPRWIETIEWALTRFDQTNLGAPRTTIHVWAEPRPECHDRAGAFTARGNDTRIDMCVTYHPGDIATGIRRRISLHELAHAWEYFNVDDATRTEFMARRGLSSWSDHDTDHNSRGVEKAAYAISYALDTTARPYSDNTCGYTILTSQPLPHPHTENCT